jgi:hypothetical protein
MHPTEQKIELFFLNAPEVKGERAQIEAHIKQCPGCGELYDEMASYYKDVESDLATRQNVGLILKQNFPTHSEQFLIKEFRQWVANREVNMAFPVRVARWVVRHPYISSGSAATFFGSLIFAALTLYNLNFIPIRDKNPVDVEFKGQVMIVKNKFAEPLDTIWIGKRLADGFTTIQNESGDLPIAFVDADGDGVDDIIWTQGLVGKDKIPAGVNSIVICKSINKNSILWSDTLTCRLSFPSENNTFYENFHCVGIKAGDNDADGIPEVYVLSHHADLFPSVLFKLDAKTGRELDAFIHAGQLKELKFLDINNDGITEILTTGTNNSFNNGCIIILDPRFISGYSLATKNYIPEDYLPATEYAYIRIPKTKFSVSSKSPNYRNIVVNPEIYESNKEFRIVVNDFSSETETAQLFINFDFDLGIKNINTNDQFAKLSKMLLDEGLINILPDNIYFQEFKKEILYWDGHTWVNYPAMNKRYVEALSKLKPPA